MNTGAAFLSPIPVFIREKIYYENYLRLPFSQWIFRYVKATQNFTISQMYEFNDYEKRQCISTETTLIIKYHTYLYNWMRKGDKNYQSYVDWTGEFTIVRPVSLNHWFQKAIKSQTKIIFIINNNAVHGKKHGKNWGVYTALLPNA